MKRICWLFSLVICLSLTFTLVNAANKIVPTGDASHTVLKLSADEPVAGAAIALRFAEPGSPVICEEVTFAGGVADYVNNDEQNGVKFTIINNVEKTVLAVVIPFTAEAIPPGNEGVLLSLKFKGGNVKLEETTVCQQKGITLVGKDAKTLEFDGFNTVELVSKSEVLPTEFTLSQNYPNPFNPNTTICYALPNNCHVELYIYNVLGQRVKTLVKGEQTAGYKTVTWDGTNDNGRTVSSGIYFFTINAGSFTKTAKMGMLK